MEAAHTTAAFIAIAITAVWMAIGLAYFALNSRSKESRIFPFPGQESEEDKHRKYSIRGAISSELDLDQTIFPFFS